MLHNHGLLTVGDTIADAFLALHLRDPCTIQVRAQAGGGPLRLIGEEILASARDFSRVATKGLGGEMRGRPCCVA